MMRLIFAVDIVDEVVLLELVELGRFRLPNNVHKLRETIISSRWHWGAKPNEKY